jgi:SOS-response transcriptional repressor LexA
MSKLAIIIKSLMREKNISTTELARQINISQPVLHRLSTGETTNPQIATLIPIARFFSVTLDQLVGNTSQLNTPSWTTVPLLTWEQIINWLDQRSSMAPLTKCVSTNIPANKNNYAIQVNNSAMLPRFSEGTLLIINPDYIPEDQDFIIVHSKGQKYACFKQLLTDGETSYLKSLNPDFQTIPLSKDHRILGTMVQARIDYGYTKKHAPD